MSSPEGIILEQFYNELKERGIKVGNKVKLRNGDIDIIIDIDNRKYGSSYPIVLSSDSRRTIDGIYILKSESDYDVVDWNYKEPEDITSNHPDVSYWDNGEVIEDITSNHPDVSYWDNGFIKHDKCKPMVSLIEPKFIEGLAEVMTQGANKYGRDNWQECKEPHRYLDALLRHTLKYWDGEKVDTESGKSHLYHIAFNAMALGYLDNKLKD